MRAIDADAMLARLEEWNTSDSMDRALYNFTMNRILEQPTIEPEQHWIPCSERFPENDDWQIVSILDESGDTPYRYSDFGWYLDKAESWIIDAEQRTDIIAWMPLPEPYAERRTDGQSD